MLSLNVFVFCANFMMSRLWKRTASYCGADSLSTISNIMRERRHSQFFFLRHSTLLTHFILSWNWNLKERMLNCHVICNIYRILFILRFLLLRYFFSLWILPQKDTISFTAIPCNSSVKLDDLIRIKLLLDFLLVRELSRELWTDLNLKAGPRSVRSQTR